ncbi:hypothetical protein ACEN8I_16140 [Polaromonas sp. CT11-55]|uniref:hypothetical protein n=1 Tax=Polaromonas sp. CT11-55 TaxID=3243045 RepID=UPI0039A46F55
MTPFTATALASAAFLLGLAVGGRAGWLSRDRQARPQATEVLPAAGAKVAEPYGPDSLDLSCLWDPHSCLNALNRCIISAPAPLVEDHQLYLVSDHLKLLAQLCHSGGWISLAGLREWLLALMALQPKGGAAGGGKAWNLLVPESAATAVRELQVQPLGMALLPLLRQAGPGADVSIEAGSACHRDGKEELDSLMLRLRVSEGRKADVLSSGGTAPALREWDVQVVCECVCG